MIEKIIFETFVLYQLTQIVVESTLFEPVRQFVKQQGFKFIYKLISCFLCTSVWIGFSLFWIFDYAQYIGIDYRISWFFNGLFFSCLTWFLHIIEEKLGK